MQKTIFGIAPALAAVTLTALPIAAFAEDPPPVTYNIGVVSDYRYRGISQSRLKPALQGGIDYANPSGFYLGNWNSTISWIKDAGKLFSPPVNTGSTPLEIDLYGGYKGDVIKDALTFDVGGLYYLYASNKYDKIGANANTFELYGALTYGVFTAKYSHSLTNIFGFGGKGVPDSKGSGYLDLSAAVEVGSGFTLTPHIGHQQIRHYSIASYTDYALTVAKDVGGGISLSATVQGTDVKKISGVSVYPSPSGKDLGKSTLVVGAKFSF